MNGTPYGGWFSPHCRSLVVSGLIGGKAYHVVLVVFATRDSFEPQLSNEVVCTHSILFLEAEKIRGDFPTPSLRLLMIDEIACENSRPSSLPA